MGIKDVIQNLLHRTKKLPTGEKVLPTGEVPETPIDPMVDAMIKNGGDTGAVPPPLDRGFQVRRDRQRARLEGKPINGPKNGEKARG